MPIYTKNEEANDLTHSAINLDNFAEDDVQDDIEVIEAVEAPSVVLNLHPTDSTASMYRIRKFECGVLTRNSIRALRRRW